MKMAIASCCKIRGQKSQQIQPAWGAIENENPDLLVLAGDNVYMRQGGEVRWDFKQLESVYEEQFKETHFSSLIASVPFLATWDDHDFGPNDSRGDTYDGRPHRAKSRKLFHKYMANAINDNRPEVYCSHVVGDVKVIMLDGRYYRTDLRQKNPAVLGSKQEKWLYQELQHDKKYTVVVSGTCLKKGSENDSWYAYREAYERIVSALLEVPRLLFVSGDIHRNMFVNHGKFFEVISSGIGRNEPGGPLDNYGIIDFGKTRVTVSLRGRRPSDRIEERIQSSNWKLS